MERPVFRYSRKSTFFYLIGSLTLAALSLTVAMQGAGEQARAATWMSAACVLSSLALAWTLVRPVVLVVDADGFTIGGRFKWKPETVLWRDVGEFFVQSTGRGMVAVAYKLSKPAKLPRDYSRLADLADRAPSPDAFRLLPTGWDEKPERMAAALNSYRRAALDGVSHRTRA